MMSYRSSDFELMLNNYRLTTAQIFYHLPDHPSLLQWFLWQQMDQAPDFPVLKRFLHFWEQSIEARLHSVQITHCDDINPTNFIYADEQILIH